ncbi:MAG: hypothetical protein LKI24_13910 [Acidipropionibacterium sp.]|nr:hypothetical protein [Acidipropionibacterium sp.]
MQVPGSGRLGRQARRAIESGDAIRPLPGVLMAARLESDPDAWVFANGLWRQPSVVTGRAALRLQGLRDLKTPVVDALLPYTFPDHGLLRFHYSTSPAPLTEVREISTWGRALVAAPAEAALFLGAREDWEPVCAALNRGITTAEAIRQVRELPGRRPDAQAMDRVVRYLSESPWSVPELEFHELLRLVGITGWKGNLPVLLHPTVDGRTCVKKRHPDAAFVAEKLAVEIASLQYHNSAEAFAEDALRARWFAAEGWRQMPVTPYQLRNNPNDLLADLCSQLYRNHRPPGLPRVRYQPTAPFWRIDGAVGR